MAANSAFVEEYKMFGAFKNYFGESILLAFPLASFYLFIKNTPADRQPFPPDSDILQYRQ
jgi:hypothetical protein